MKILRTLMYLGIILSVLYIVLCFTGPEKFVASKSIETKAAPEVVFVEVTDFSKWPAWSPWQQMDPTLKNTYAGTPGMVGHSNSWSGKDMGEGTQTIIKIAQPDLNSYHVSVELIFKQWDGVSHSDFIIEPSGTGSKVTWTMEGSKINFFLRGLMVILGAQKSLEKDYETGLNNLRPIVEAKQ